MHAPGFLEIVALAVIALLVFGPERLPEMARKAGKGIAKFKAEASATMDELKRSADLEEFRDAGKELRSVGKEIRGAGNELKAVSALTGPMASAARPGRPGEATVRAVPEGPAPFDPDAT